jgi:two-component system, OmpR family, copper resistance phosphate regulon response regulator CusR
MQRSTIVCIDDDLDTLIGCQSLLWNHGYNVLISTSGSQGLELVKSLPIDAVILDFQMPGMDGGMVATEIKKFKPHVPVMMLTAQESLPDEVLEQVDVFFPKGESPRELLAALHAMLSDCMPPHARSLRDDQAKAA